MQGDLWLQHSLWTCLKCRKNSSSWPLQLAEPGSPMLLPVSTVWGCNTPGAYHWCAHLRQRYLAWALALGANWFSWVSLSVKTSHFFVIFGCFWLSWIVFTDKPTTHKLPSVSLEANTYSKYAYTKTLSSRRCIAAVWNTATWEVDKLLMCLSSLYDQRLLWAHAPFQKGG